MHSDVAARLKSCRFLRKTSNFQSPNASEEFREEPRWRSGSEKSVPINPLLTLSYAKTRLLNDAHVQNDAIIPMRIVIALRPWIASQDNRGPG